jgi:endo-1,4-beta-xylanase
MKHLKCLLFIVCLSMQASRISAADYHVSLDGAGIGIQGHYQLPDGVQRRLADPYVALFALFLKHRDKVKRVTFWGLHDGLSWLNQFPSERTNHPLLWYRSLRPKAAFFSVLETARRGALNAFTP